MTDIVIGCPVANRAWILPLWKEYIDLAMPENTNVKFIFVCPDWDYDSLDILKSWENSYTTILYEPYTGVKRTWGNKQRYHHMSYLRNILLEKVRSLNPDFYLSLDSDILIDKRTIKGLLETYENNDINAVGGYTFLDPIDKHCTNIAMWQNYISLKSFKRVVTSGVHKVDILMAIKMFDKTAYKVDYVYHDMGEDFGWASNAIKSGIVSYVDARFPAKHVMAPEYLNIIDKRVGF